MRKAGRAALRCAGVIALSIGPAFAQVAPDASAPAGPVDPDPLRVFLPRDDIFMQVPGAVLAIEGGAKPDATVEQQKENRNGGLVVGYCLRASCARVTHLAVLQVCGNQTGGPEGTNHLILGIVRLPYGDTPGYLMSLRGRDYLENFSSNGPFVQTLLETGSADATSLLAMSATGIGPVEALEFQGLSVKDEQRPETVALQMDMVRNRISGARFPHFEVRHYCRRQLS